MLVLWVEADSLAAVFGDVESRVGGVDNNALCGM